MGFQRLCVVVKMYSPEEGVINSLGRLSDVPGHRDVTAKWSVRRAEFSKMAVLLFFMWTLWAYFFPCHEAAMWFLFWSRIPLPYIPTEEVSAFWLLRENSAKKVSEGFRWVSKLGKLCECGATFRPGGGTLGISGWGCAAGILEPLTYTRASSAEFCYPILE